MRFGRLVSGFVVAAVLFCGVPACLAQGGDAAGAAAGEPFSVEAVIQDMKRQWDAGGLTMWWILFLSILGLAFVLERAFRLRKKFIVPTGFADEVNRLWKAGKYDEIEKECDRHKKSTLSKIVRFMIHHRSYPPTDISQVAGDIASRDIGHHHMLVYPLVAVTGLSPLLGLFGTVIGMIESFETVAIAGSMGDPSLLASGIAKALVTTAWGLMVAMPSIFFFNVLKFRTNILANMLEEEASGLIHEWFMQKEGHNAN
jgi:biopolymer transport protein ExbB